MIRNDDQPDNIEESHQMMSGYDQRSIDFEKDHKKVFVSPHDRVVFPETFVRFVVVFRRFDRRR